MAMGTRPSIYSYLVGGSSKGDRKCCFWIMTFLAVGGRGMEPLIDDVHVVQLA